MYMKKVENLFRSVMRVRNFGLSVVVESSSACLLSTCVILKLAFHYVFYQEVGIHFSIV